MVVTATMMMNPDMLNEHKTRTTTRTSLTTRESGRVAQRVREGATRQRYGMRFHRPADAQLLANGSIHSTQLVRENTPDSDFRWRVVVESSVDFALPLVSGGGRHG